MRSYELEDPQTMTIIKSPAFQKIAKAARDNASDFLSGNSAHESDQYINNALKIRDEECLFKLGSGLCGSSNFHWRIGFSELIGDKKYNVGLIDSWQANVLGEKFYAQAAICLARTAKTPDKLFSQFAVTRLPADINQLAFSLWKLYAAGHEYILKSMVSFFEVFDVRQDAARYGYSGAELEANDVAVCVSLFIGRGKADVATAERLLGTIPVFKGISRFWVDDEEFVQFTERTAQWHFDYSKKHLAKDSSFAHTAAEILIPSWVLALDVFRQKELGRPSCLGSHELLDLSVALVTLAKSQNYPKPAAFVAAEKHYEELFGNEVFNPLPFWEKFLGVSPQ